MARGKGTIHGAGLVGTRLILRGELVWELEEPTFTWTQIKTCEEDRRRAFARYGFQCGVDRYSLPEGLSREANHSCDPNTWWAGSDAIVARRDIRVGEAITDDYSTCDVDLVFAMTCRCEAPPCRKRITNQDYLDPTWQAQSGTHLPPHVLAAIEVARRRKMVVQDNQVRQRPARTPVDAPDTIRWTPPEQNVNGRSKSAVNVHLKTSSQIRAFSRAAWFSKADLLPPANCKSMAVIPSIIEPYTGVVRAAPATSWALQQTDSARPMPTTRDARQRRHFACPLFAVPVLPEMRFLMTSFDVSVRVRETGWRKGRRT